MNPQHSDSPGQVPWQPRIGERVQGPDGRVGTVVGTAHFKNATDVEYDQPGERISSRFVTEMNTDLTLTGPPSDRPPMPSPEALAAAVPSCRFCRSPLNEDGECPSMCDGYPPEAFAPAAPRPAMTMAEINRELGIPKREASDTITSDVGTLRPAENMALTAARAQLERGENPPRNTTAMLVAIVERLAGIRDYQDDDIADGA